MHVFLSHSGKDNELVAKLREDLQKAGIEVWWYDDILPGQSWKKAIREAIHDSYAMIFCFSENTSNLTYRRIVPELREAVARYRTMRPGSTFLIPVRFADVPVADFSVGHDQNLRDFQYVDLFPTDSERLSEGVQKLVKALKLAKSETTRSYFDPQLESEVENFERALPWGQSLVDRLWRDEAFITGLQGDNKLRRWFIQLELPASLVESYGTAPQALILVREGEITGKDMQAAKELLLRREFELDRDMLIVADGTPDLGKKLESIFGQWAQWIPLSKAENGFIALETSFQRHVTAYDIFEARKAVRGRQVFGREQAVRDMLRYMRQGHAIGVFGLRKVGKTTAVRAFTDKLDPPGGGRIALPVVWLDAERLVQRTLGDLATIMTRLLADKIDQLGYEDMAPDGDGASMSQLDRFIGEILQRLEKPLCLVIDEYDYLFEGGGGESGVPDVATFFRMLRGHAQETEKLSLVLIGRDPSRIDQPLMAGFPNPMLGWMIDFWPGPLGEADAGDLLRQLGKRVRLDVGPETVNEIYQWTGGHPLLHRQFGSALLAHALPGMSRMSHRSTVATDPLLDVALASFKERNAVKTICQEVHHLLHTRYPEAANLFAELISAGMRRNESSKRHNAWSLLQRFGLVVEQNERVFIPEVYRWYMTSMVDHLQRETA